MSVNYHVEIDNKDKKPNETNIYRSSLNPELDLSKGPTYETLQDVYIKFSETCGRPVLGFRRKSPYGNYENKYYFYSG